MRRHRHRTQVNRWPMTPLRRWKKAHQKDDKPETGSSGIWGAWTSDCNPDRWLRWLHPMPWSTLCVLHRPVGRPACAGEFLNAFHNATTKLQQRKQNNATCDNKDATAKINNAKSIIKWQHALLFYKVSQNIYINYYWHQPCVDACNFKITPLR